MLISSEEKVFECPFFTESVVGKKIHSAFTEAVKVTVKNQS
jgi:hypothetical protein